MGRKHSYNGNAKKRVRSTVRPNTGALFMLRCSELGLTVADLDSMTIGMVYDMLIEKSNDKAEYPYQATQDDIDKFFK